jgi:hypothetical protein
MLPVYFFVGCAISAFDGSSPRGYNWVIVANHRLKNLKSSTDNLNTFVSFQNHEIIADADD